LFLDKGGYMGTLYEVCFQLILHAGDTKSAAMEAINYSNDFNFDKANEFVINAVNELKKAHSLQTGLIQNEANGNMQEVNILLVHAQDHLSMAMMAIDLAKQSIKINKKLFDLEQKLNDRR